MTNSITLRDFIVFLILSIISMAIWRLGPALLVANHYPLYDPEKRFVVIITLFSAWFVLNLTFSAPRAKKTIQSIDTPETIKKLKALQGRFQGVTDFLKKVHLSHLPWYAFIGPKNSGKTSLLAHSSINFLLAKQFKPDTLKSISPSEHCDWWVTRDLVLLDVPSTYIHSKDKSDKSSPRASLHQVLWHNLLNLVREHREAPSLNGIVIALHLPELMRQSHLAEKKSIIIDIRNHIKELRERFGKNIPCYLVITKCDYLPGFLDFFSESGSDETAQYWGITLPALNPNEKLTEVVTHHFNILLKRLNKQLISRLHQERNINARSFIKDFPLHVERLKEATNQFLKSIAPPQLNLQGIFFTSALQPQINPVSSEGHFTIDQSQALSLMQPPAIPSRPYFIRQLILQGLLHTHVQQLVTAEAQKTNWQRAAILATSTAIVLTAGWFLGEDFQQGVQQTRTIEAVLTEYQTYLQSAQPEEIHLTKALSMLNALHDAAINPSHPIASLFNFYSNQSQQTAQGVYLSALQTIVLPEVKNTFENALKSPENKSPAKLYAVLKAYLMLGDQSHLEPGFIENTLRDIAPMDKQTLDQLTTHIVIALKNMKAPMSLNQELISSVRKTFSTFSNADLAYFILQNTGNNNLDSGINIAMNEKSNTPIPIMYTANAFQTILDSGIATAASDATSGNWIIGNPDASTQNNAELTQQLRTLYIANYTKTWENQLDHIELTAPKNLADLDKMLASLTSDHSPLLETLQTIQQNTTFAEVTASSQKLQTLNTLLANASTDQTNVLYETFVSLRELHLYLQNMVQSSDVGQAAFVAAKDHAEANANDPITSMHTLAATVPDPMKTWLNNLANQTWSLIIQSTARYIDHNWQNQITEPYAANVINRFPFSRNATKEVPIQTFIELFGQPGALSVFYQTFIQPFSTVTNDEINWRTIDQQSLPLNPEVLTAVASAEKIQHAFFPNGDNKLYVPFSLQPLAFSDDIKSFALSINGQDIGYTKGSLMEPHVVAWPGNTIKAHSTSMNIATTLNQSLANTYQGDWGWFRLVEQATQGISNRKEMLLEFTVDGHNAKYQLFTEGRVNPFLPENLERFQLPLKLLITDKA